MCLSFWFARRCFLFCVCLTSVVFPSSLLRRFLIFPPAVLFVLSTSPLPFLLPPFSLPHFLPSFLFTPFRGGEEGKGVRNARIDLGLHGHLAAVGATLFVVDKVVRGRTTSWACLELAVVSCIASCRYTRSYPARAPRSTCRSRPRRPAGSKSCYSSCPRGPCERTMPRPGTRTRRIGLLGNLVRRISISLSESCF